MSSIPGSVGYISYPMFIEPTITRVPLGFSEYIWLDTKIMLKKVTKGFLSKGMVTVLRSIGSVANEHPLRRLRRVSRD